MKNQLYTEEPSSWHLTLSVWWACRAAAAGSLAMPLELGVCKHGLLALRVATVKVRADDLSFGADKGTNRNNRSGSNSNNSGGFNSSNRSGHSGPAAVIMVIVTRW